MSHNPRLRHGPVRAAMSLASAIGVVLLASGVVVALAMIRQPSGQSGAVPSVAAPTATPSASETVIKQPDGSTLITLPEGFSVDVPAGWSVYHPQDDSPRSRAVLTISSSASVLCPSDNCDRSTTPSGAAIVEFRVGRTTPVPPEVPAPTIVPAPDAGGPPRAPSEDWTSPASRGADEGHTWMIYLGDRWWLEIFGRAKGPSLPALHASMFQVVNSVHVRP